MDHLNLRLGQYSLAIVFISRWLMIAALMGFVTYVGVRGISESWDNDGFPEALAVKLELMPIVFPVHMVAGGLALLLVPLVLVLRGSRWHKIVGRIAAVDILIAGVTALPVAVLLPVTKISAAGFAAQGITWLVLLACGIWHVRQRNYAAHRACMLMMAAVTSGALFFRLYLGLWKGFGALKYFYVFYAVDAWVAWGLPLLAMAAWLRATRSRPSVLS